MCKAKAPVFARWDIYTRALRSESLFGVSVVWPGHPHEGEEKTKVN